MKPHLSIRSLTAMAAIVLGLALAVPGAAIAGEYEVALGVIEAAVGPIGDTNDAAGGSVYFAIVGLVLEAKAAKAGGDDALALEKMLQAEAIVVSIQ